MSTENSIPSLPKYSVKIPYKFYYEILKKIEKFIEENPGEIPIINLLVPGWDLKGLKNPPIKLKLMNERKIIEEFIRIGLNEIRKKADKEKMELMKKWDYDEKTASHEEKFSEYWKDFK